MERRVLVVIPAWNEAPNIEAVLAELRAARPADAMVVVDDGSTDGTAALARRAGAGVLQLPFHIGYGAAIQAGIKYGQRGGYRVVVTFDGDGQHDPADIAPLVEAVEQGADLVLGSRFLAPTAFRGSLARRAGRGILSIIARRLTGLSLTDPTSGLKARGPDSTSRSGRRACAARATATACTTATAPWPIRSTCSSRSSWPPPAARPTSGGDPCRCGRRSSS